MISSIEIKCRDFNLKIFKHLHYDDYFSSTEIDVFVRGNGFFLEPTSWIKADDIKSLYQTKKLEPKNIDGTFLIIIFDKIENELVVVTDHLNFFPLYYSSEEDLFSDSLLPFKNAKLDHEAINELFSINTIIGRKTIYSSIEKLPPASVINYKQKQLKNAIYWHCNPVETSEVDFKGTFRNTISRVAQLSKNPSLTLTAGLDSRMVFSELIHQEIPFKTFTFGHKKAIDVQIARQISSDFNIPHTAYQTDNHNNDFIKHFSRYADESVIYSDGMVPYLRGCPAQYCFDKEALHSDMIVTATGELVYSHFAEVPTLMTKDNSSIDSIADFLINFNSSHFRKSNNLESLKRALKKEFEQYSFSRNYWYYDLFYLIKLSGLTSYYQQSLSSNTRIYNPIFSKEMINRSMGLYQKLRDHRKLQRQIIVENEGRLNEYLVNGYKVVIPTPQTLLKAKFYYGLRLAKKVINKIAKNDVFKLSYLDLDGILKRTRLLKKITKVEILSSYPIPDKRSSLDYKLSYISLAKWLSFKQSNSGKSD